ncbi:E3 ubiquitin-protein ligase RGLG2-like [Cucurbita maxima]|uniref:E3 ubiquitin-protein ligase RGLG2-like n=1 Tax=Cucurbita maxima TaxID=3661 RepID=A0A6J1JLZ7_CUCMA|nr:E3 ubiquitin-protein ligase RGLG2-like [Cucurbita maxima]XP_022990090.1 E3 ubiquitin-protein ligase RGLG2-like [Cucurbita maxima]XP_022990091.1 E3 ubiquitin-protein ligase RGLG2-like [Cucurbita maxima]XP_022990092.1 E3 ubiquitin-protein ligase RGLG2-like [Cucurbita maxima]XP_022990093.1 E3 ubiquitin-protein ligase RGLG2-like [Cucurbita maxima]
MGAKSSREASFYRSTSSSSPSSSSWDRGGYSHSSYGHETPSHMPQQSYSQSSYGHETPSYMPQPTYPSQQYYKFPQEAYGNVDNGRRLDRRYSMIADDYHSLEEVTQALRVAGLESSNLIVGIDFTKSNEWTGARSFNRRSLHHIGDHPNPYQQAISIIGKTLAAFDDDSLIPCFGFGDVSTHDQEVFSFFPDEEKVCNGFEEVLSRYQEIAPHLRLAGPTSFAPVIEMAMTIVEQSGGQYHILLIIADGQVTRSVDTERGTLSPQEQKTVDAIVEASKFPLSIVLVGVGDGPWDMMREFDDNIPSRAFDNFQFVNFSEIMSKNIPTSRKETEFALAALMEIPSQYKATMELGVLGDHKSVSPQRVALPPPVYGAAASFGSSKSFSNSKPTLSSSYEPSVPSFPERGNLTRTSTAPPIASSTYDNQLCPICLSNPKDMAFGCGHQTCCECGQDLQTCPICRSAIHTRIKLY